MESQSVSTKKFHKFLDETPMPMKTQFFDAAAVEAASAKARDKTQTYHEGANDERTAILAIVRRMVKEQPEDTEVMISGTSLVKKLLTRVKRNKAKQGGL